MSGQHVVYGFLRPLISWMKPEHEIVEVHYDSMQPPQDVLQQGVNTVSVPDRQKHWARRTFWEATKLPKIVRQQKADVVLTVSGALTPNCPVPQVVLCQNPWCYRPMAQYSFTERFKANLQRSGYSKAFKNADLMLYISNHLQSLYQAGNVGHTEKRSDIAHVGLNEETYISATELAGIDREPFSIVSVSAMARWKGAETLVEAVKLLRQRDIPATLKLVGPWPEAAYKEQIRQQIADSNLSDAVQILGKVSNEDLHRLYATSQVFSLMSSCESFGIPAAEAMCFGTPVVSTNCCAISEICEGAGLFGPVTDPEWTANALGQVLTDSHQWQVWSEAAKANAVKLTWENCTTAFRRIPELVGESIRPIPSLTPAAQRITEKSSLDASLVDDIQNQN